MHEKMRCGRGGRRTDCHTGDVGHRCGNDMFFGVRCVIGGRGRTPPLRRTRGAMRIGRRGEGTPPYGSNRVGKRANTPQKRRVCLHIFIFRSALRILGHNDGGDDIGQHAAAAQGAEHDPAQTHQRGVNVEILGNAAAHAAQNLVLAGFIQSFSNNRFPPFFILLSGACVPPVFSFFVQKVTPVLGGRDALGLFEHLGEDPIVPVARLHIGRFCSRMCQIYSCYSSLAQTHAFHNGEKQSWGLH